jgi:phosphoribosylformylglycinamidine synthase subunit PurS
LSRFRIEVRVTPRPGLLDPEGKAIQHALTSLGYAGAGDVRVGKLIELDLQAASEEAALETARLMCRRLLANPVTEDYDVRVAEAADVPSAAGATGGSAR